jgi:hypothetical protein
MLAKIVPHVADFGRRLASQIAIARENHRLFVVCKLIELKGGLDEKSDGAVEEIRPNLPLEWLAKVLPYDSREMPQTFENNRVLMHCHVIPIEWKNWPRNEVLKHQQYLV